MLGVGIAKSKTGKFYVVCNYDPPGNFVGEYKENVPPPLSALKKPATTPKPEQPAKSNSKKKKKKQAEDQGLKAQTSKAEGGNPKSADKVDSAEDCNFAIECLEAHNELRQKHEVVELTLDPKLTKYAEEWARILAKEDKMSHRPERKYGENIYSFGSRKPGEKISGRDPVSVWYKEIENHEFFKEPTNAKTGHFTQVVWKDSLRLGVGVAKSKSNRFYVVANYDPPGNYAGEFKTCVPPVGGFVTKDKQSQSEPSKSVVSPSVQKPEDEEAPAATNEVEPPRAQPDAEVESKPSAEGEISLISQVPKMVLESESQTGKPSGEEKPEVVGRHLPTGKSFEIKFDKSEKYLSSGRGQMEEPKLTVIEVKQEFEVTATMSKKDEQVHSSDKAFATQLSLNQGKLQKQERIEEEVVVGQIFSDFQINCLNAQNKYREEHKVGPLALSSELCSRAADWAEHLASIDRMESRNDTEYGENLYCYWSSNLSKKLVGHEPVQSWYQEIDVYDFRAVDDLHPKAGNFTQMIWKSSKRMGVAVARSDSGKFYVVANYEPIGNELGKYQQNVFPKGGPTEEALELLRKSEFDLGIFSEECLVKHNAYRALHGADPLRLSKKISKHAQTWADSLAELDTTIQHRAQRKYGENIYSVYGPGGQWEVTGDSPVTCWYNELKQYTFGKEPNNLKAGHFTQVVWRASRKLGIGAAWSSSGRLYVVCNYDPPGNIIGKFLNNVCPLGWKEKYTSSEESSDEEIEDEPTKIALEDFVKKTPEEEAPNSKEVKMDYVNLQVDLKEEKNIQANNSAEAEKKFIEECVKLHNMYRKLHMVPQLELDDELAKKAEEHAAELARIDYMKPYSTDEYGENLFSRWSSKGKFDLSPQDVIGTWYSESQKYNYDAEPKILTSGHFTQLIWKKSHRVGIGKARSTKSGRVYVVALYDPPGNYKGYFKNNVFAPIKSDQSEC